MSTSTYGDLLRDPAIRRIFALSLLIRVPLWAASIVLTLHVVDTLDQSYSAAGVLVGLQTVALAISGPWRGRRLDRSGLRRTVLPSVVVTATAWSIAPWFGYPVLLVCAVLAGLFVIPTFSIVRMVLINAVEPSQRKAVLALDSVMVEVSFMIGPVLGVLLATYVDTRVALFATQATVVAGGLLLYAWNPPLAHQSRDAGAPAQAGRSWISPAVVAILACSVVTTAVLTGADLGSVAGLREMGAPHAIGWVLAVWGLGSALGGFAYGAMSWHPSSMTLLLMLALTSIPVALANSPLTFALLLFVTGLFCAPTITSTVNDLTDTVPERVRGEAMGWHGSSLTAGSAAGAPLIGFAIDHRGWEAAFVAPGIAGALLAVIGMTMLRRRRARRASTPSTAPATAPTSDPTSDVDAEGGEDLARGLAPVEGVEVQARRSPVE